MPISSSYSTEDLGKGFILAVVANNLPALRELGQMLVQRGVEYLQDLYDGLSGLNALLIAAVTARGNIDVVKYLVEELNFDVNVQDDIGDTPLHVSIMEEDLASVIYLVLNGADLNIGNDRGLTPLHYAAKTGYLCFVSFLISKGAKVDAISTIFGTALQDAACHGMDDVVSLLLDNQANPNLANANTDPPLMLAIKAKSLACVRLLLEWGADPNTANRELTPLTAAAQQGQNDIIKLLLQKGADPNMTNFVNLTPLEIAAQLGNHVGVRILFTATNPIPQFPKWSVRDILEYVNSVEAKIKGSFNIEEKCLEAKVRGSEAASKKHFVDAIHWYTQALRLKPTDAEVLFARSLGWTQLFEGDSALEDAMSCMSLKEDWPQAHYCAGVAYVLLEDDIEAEKEFEIAIKLDPENTVLQDDCRSVLNQMSMR